MGTTRPRPVVLDASALIAFDRNDRRMRSLVRAAIDERARVLIPAGALAEAWRDGSRQVTLAVLVGSSHTEIVALDESVAKAAGALCGRARTSDVIDASVVIAARTVDAVIVSSDSGDILRLDQHAEVRWI